MGGGIFEDDLSAQYSSGNHGVLGLPLPCIYAPCSVLSCQVYHIAPMANLDPPGLFSVDSIWNMTIECRKQLGPNMQVQVIHDWHAVTAHCKRLYFASPIIAVRKYVL